MIGKTRGSQPIENPRGRGTLTLDGETVLRVSFDIKVYQNYLEGDGIKERTDYSVKGTIGLIERIRGMFIKSGEETNVLDMGNGRMIDIHPPVLIKQEGFTFSSLHDQMTFFETDFYRNREKED